MDKALEEKLARYLELKREIDELLLELSDFVADVRNFANAYGIGKTEEGNHE